MKRIFTTNRLLSMVLPIVFLSLLSSPAKAIENRASDYIYTCYATASSGSMGKVEIEFSITGLREMDEIGASSIIIYEDDGNGFEVVKTFLSSNNGYEYLLRSNNRKNTASVTYTGNIGDRYYAKVYFLARDSSGGDTEIITTNVVTAQ